MFRGFCGRPATLCSVAESVTPSDKDVGTEYSLELQVESVRLEDGDEDQFVTAATPKFRG